MSIQVVFISVQMFQVQANIGVSQSLSIRCRVLSLQIIFNHAKYWLDRDRKQILYMFSKLFLK